MDKILDEARAFIKKEGSLKGFPLMRELNNFLEENDWWISESTGRVVISVEHCAARRKTSFWVDPREKNEGAFWVKAHAHQMNHPGRAW